MANDVYSLCIIVYYCFFSKETIAFTAGSFMARLVEEHNDLFNDYLQKSAKPDTTISFEPHWGVFAMSFNLKNMQVAFKLKFFE